MAVLMEVVGGIASIGSLLGGTITTIKFFYRSVQHIRQASNTVEYLVSAVDDFLLLLERLEQIVGRVKEEASIDCEALQIFLIKCNKNFQKWQEEVSKLQDKGNGAQRRASQLLWKGRVGLKTQRLRDILATLNGDKRTLNSHLACIESDLSVHRNGAIERHPEIITTSLLESQHKAYQLLNTQQIAQQESLAQLHLSCQAGQSEVLQRLYEISIRLGKQSTEEIKASGIGTVIDDFRSVDGIPTNDKTPELNSDATRGLEENELVNIESISGSEVEYQKISGESVIEAIERLNTLASGRGKTVLRAIDDEDSIQSIIEDLGQVLELASYELGLRQRIQHPKLRQEIRGDYFNSTEEWAMSQKSITLARDMKRMMGMLNSTQSLAIDSRAISRPPKASRKLFTLRNDYYDIDTAYGSFVLNLTLHQSKGKEKTNETLSREHDKLLEVYSADMSFIPNDSNPRCKIAAFFVQKSIYEGSFTSTPRISFSAIIPYDSEVLWRIEDGDLKNLIKMFDRKMASLTDCDPKGRSLLNYACHSSSHHISKFLIERGANIDSVEPSFEKKNQSHLPLLFQKRPYFENSNGSCRRTLLEAGADPTLEADFGVSKSNYLEDAVIFGDQHILKDVLHCSAPFFDLEERDHDGATLLLRSFHGRDTGCAKCLIENGADVKVRTNKGLTILHCLAKSFRYTDEICVDGPQPKMKLSADILREFSPFIYSLIQQGIDINALTLDGDTISNLVYRNHVFLQKAWEEALSMCGHNTIEVLKEHLLLCGWRPSVRLPFLETPKWPTNDIEIIRQLLKHSGSDFENVEDKKGLEIYRRREMWLDFGGLCEPLDDL